MKTDMYIPGSVPCAAQETYKTNLNTLTAHSGFLLLVADHRIEQRGTGLLYNTDIPESLYPSHMFRIAAQGRIPLVTQYGFIAQYGTQFPSVPYIVKMTATTSSVPVEIYDPQAAPVCTIEDIIALQKNTHLTISGIGLHIYLGSLYESAMLSYAARTIIQAQYHGLVTVVWIYVQGKHIEYTNQITPAELAYVAASLGTDFVTLVPNNSTEQTAVDTMRFASSAAEHTGVLCTDGEYNSDIPLLLHTASLYKNKGHTAGLAVERNLLHRSLPEASALAAALKAIAHQNSDSHTAYELYQKMVKNQRLSNT